MKTLIVGSGVSGLAVADYLKDKNIDYVFADELELNFDKFHYNPISVDSTTVQFFPYVETLHLYEEIDDRLEGGNIQRYVNWNRIDYTNYII